MFSITQKYGKCSSDVIGVVFLSEMVNTTKVEETINMQNFISKLNLSFITVVKFEDDNLIYLNTECRKLLTMSIKLYLIKFIEHHNLT